MGGLTPVLTIPTKLHTQACYAAPYCRPTRTTRPIGSRLTSTAGVQIVTKRESRRSGWCCGGRGCFMGGTSSTWGLAIPTGTNVLWSAPTGPVIEPTRITGVLLTLLLLLIRRVRMLLALWVGRVLWRLLLITTTTIACIWQHRIPSCALLQVVAHATVLLSACRTG